MTYCTFLFRLFSISWMTNIAYCVPLSIVVFLFTHRTWSSNALMKDHVTCNYERSGSDRQSSQYQASGRGWGSRRQAVTLSWCHEKQCVCVGPAPSVHHHHGLHWLLRRLREGSGASIPQRSYEGNHPAGYCSCVSTSGLLTDYCCLADSHASLIPLLWKPPSFSICMISPGPTCYTSQVNLGVWQILEPDGLHCIYFCR